MKSFKAIPAKKAVVLLMLVTGGALLSYSLYTGSSKQAIPGWTAVNEPLQAALDTLTSEPPVEAPEVKEESPANALRIEPWSTTPHTSDTPTATTSQPLQVDTTPLPSTQLLDLNKATQSQLETLPGIGPSKAKAILTYREQNNGFQRVDQLIEVKGIGSKIYDQIAPLVQIPSLKEN